MKLKYIAFIFTIVTSVWFITSCNSDTVSYSEGGGSNDAMIYSFSLKGKMTNALDSATYPTLGKTVFAINQVFAGPNYGLIYNPDSLPYQTKLTKFLPTISFASNTASTLEVVYPDSTVTWKAEDSIDFSQSPIEFKVTSPGGESKTYAIKLNVHKIDPDTIDWEGGDDKPTWNISKVGAVGQRIVINKNNVYLFTLLSGGGMNVYNSDRTYVAWTGQSTDLPSVNYKLESLTIFNNTFYIVDLAGNAYKSTNAINWIKTNNTKNIYNILGVLPESTATKDSVLVMTKDGTKYYWGKTVDLNTVVDVDTIKGFSPNTITSDFLATGYSSMTNYDRTTASQNLLFVAGGRTFDGKLVADTWGISAGRNYIMEATPAKYENNNKMFDIAEDFKMFLYDKSLYALTNDTLYISKWGSGWSKAPQKQALNAKMKTVKDMSVTVDEYNYIWIVGDMTGGSVYNVWRGRLNRLRK